jgi:hypothetical protein
MRFIHLAADYRLNVCLERATGAFVRGLHDVIPPHWLAPFSAPELQVLLSGSCAGVDVADLQRHARLAGFSASDRLVRDFWAVASALSQRDRGALLGKIVFDGGSPVATGPFVDPNQRNLVAEVSHPTPRTFGAGNPVRVLAVDCGIKYNIIRFLARTGMELTVVRARAWCGASARGAAFAHTASHILSLPPPGAVRLRLQGEAARSRRALHLQRPGRPVHVRGDD